ncbi:MAG TPA: GtrA family protein [Gaiellaceae bacterium]|nr:GtrA family protein [Gaiellaceae bacterium]
MERARVAEGSARLGARAGRALRRPHNWVQLAKFCLVGATGYAVNLGVYTILVKGFDVHYMAAAVFSFCVAVANNYLWNRVWTFSGQRGHFYYQGLRFFIVAWCALAANLLVLRTLVALDMDEVAAQAIAIILVTPVNFLGNKLWSFRRH